MELTLDDLTLSVDAERTRRFYDGAGLVMDGCRCEGCRNYALAAERFPEAVAAFFRRLGIDPRKPSEVYVQYMQEGGETACYGGFYHLCGRITGGDAATFRDVAPGYSVAFTDEIDLREDGLPDPALQMEIDFRSVPWKLSAGEPAGSLILS